MISKKGIILILFSTTISSCKSNINSKTEYQFGNNSNYGSILERPLPDNRGIITYKDYQILVASGNETVKEISNRLNIDADRLASYNGVPSTYLPRKDEVLALPIKLTGDLNNSSSEWTIEDTRSSIENIPNESTNFGTPDNPIKHRVEPGDTAYSIARLYNVSITSLSKWNGLDADLNVIIGRELIIPVISNKKNTKLEVPSTKPKEKITLENKPKKETSLAKENETENEVKNDNKYKNQDSVLKFIRPVNGEILRKYNPTSVSNKNEGIDFAAEEGTPIKSAAAGVVALISEPVGGLGKIILIKHKDSIISIYGRVKDIKVAKGDRIIPGQVIGSVEKSSIDEEKQNYLHFELRKGTESLDPEPLFQ